MVLATPANEADMLERIREAIDEADSFEPELVMQAIDALMVEQVVREVRSPGVQTPR
jgi:hypothetical protein